MVTITHRPQLDPNGNVVGQIAIVTTLIPETIEISKEQTQADIKKAENKIARLQKELDDLNVILASYTI